MLVFIDTEFTGLQAEPKLISIGLVSEDGREFYAELSDTYELDDCDDFVLENVIPLLSGGEAEMSIHDLPSRLSGWLKSLGEPVQLAIDSLAWDWRWVQEIFANLDHWPPHVDRNPLLLTVNNLNDFDKFNDALEAAFETDFRRHHALDDAKANLMAWKAAGGTWR